jgi:hypothetical protein
MLQQWRMTEVAENLSGLMWKLIEIVIKNVEVVLLISVLAYTARATSAPTLANRLTRKTIFAIERPWIDINIVGHGNLTTSKVGVMMGIAIY